jgi:hypothetical protein
LFLNIDLGEIPCKSSIENWVQKCGHYVYEHPELSRYKYGYGLIADECMVIGQERMFVVLAVPAIKESLKGLSLCEVEILSMQVKPSWSGEQIAETLQKVEEKMGTKPVYIISDGGSTLVKGIKDYAGLRICGCGHEIARQTKQIFCYQL